MSTSPLRGRWLPDAHDLQNISVTVTPKSSDVEFLQAPHTRMISGRLPAVFLSYHTLNLPQLPARAILSPHNLAFVLLNHLVMRHPNSLEKTTIRLTDADRKILERLTELTGLKQSQLIRASLRVLLRNVERPVER